MYFVFDGITSQDMGLINVNLNSGMLEEQLMSEQSITEEKIRHNDTPYFIGVERSPFSIEFSFAFEDVFDDEKIRTITNWLGNQPYYKELYFSNEIDRRYYVIYNDSPKLIHNALKQGYITINMRSISPYTYSPALTEGQYDFSANVPIGSDITIENLGNMNSPPVIEIEKIGNGEIEIINFSNSESPNFRLTSLVDREKIIIDCQKEDITSDIPLTYHFDHVYGSYPSFVQGLNFLKVKGNCKITFKYRCIFNQC
ncbi:phage tail domain-containing protein [Paenibacillus sp. QZ-Y1]|uniref:phage tail domain-containing protein n=1 Tax=Paenibacillus sp. QZ-Y1 TaxID=3414511 RepID=UPI003F7995A2